MLFFSTDIEICEEISLHPDSNANIQLNEQTVTNGKHLLIS